MKILHIIIYSNSKYTEKIDNNAYENMQKLLSNYYKKFNNKVTTYFVKYNENVKKIYNTDYHIQDDILFIDGKETSIPGILDKTLLAFKYLNDIHYDYLIRSNISTIIDFDKLINYLSINPINYYGSGKLVDLQWNGGGINDSTWYGTIFASGTSIIFTKEAINDIINNDNIIRRDIIDDVSLGIFIREYKNIEPSQVNSKHFCEVPFFNKDEPSINNFIKHIKDKDIIFYRNKCFGIMVKNRDIDYKQMEVIIKHLT